MRKIQILLIFLFFLKAYSQIPDYYNHIKPIITKNCISCHHPNGDAPFGLTNYKDVAKRATFINQVVQNGYMPPWKASPMQNHFANSRILSENDKTTIKNWVDAKMPIGKINTLVEKEVDSFVQNNLDTKPDVELLFPKKIKVIGDNQERFVVYKVPFDFNDEADIKKIRFYCTNKKAIHHVNYGFYKVENPLINLYNTDEMVDITSSDRTKYDQYLPYKKNIVYYTGWVPGASAETYPENIGWTLPKRGILLITVHFAPMPKDENISLGVHLFRSKKAISRIIQVISFGSGGIAENSIEPPLFMPKDQISKFKLNLKNPAQDLSLLYVWPHMHNIGSEFDSFFKTPDNDYVPLVHIPKWDFNWQEMYLFKKMVKFPRNSILHIRATYDNTSNNPFNPNLPPKDIYATGDMKSTDEMMTLLLLYLPYQEGDENILLKP